MKSRPLGSVVARGMHSGFTLLEVLVAVSIGALVLLSARLVVEQLAAAGRQLAGARLVADEIAGRERWLRSLFRRIDADSSGVSAFYGDSTRMDFSSWCEAPGGWLERCRGSLAIERSSAGPVVALSTTLTGRIVIRSREGDIVIRYLAPSDTGSSWLAVWDRSVLPPVAVGLFGRDTLILRIGRRG